MIPSIRASLLVVVLSMPQLVVAQDDIDIYPSNNLDPNQADWNNAQRDWNSLQNQQSQEQQQQYNRNLDIENGVTQTWQPSLSPTFDRDGNPDGAVGGVSIPMQ